MQHISCAHYVNEQYLKSLKNKARINNTLDTSQEIQYVTMIKTKRLRKFIAP